MHSMFTAEFLSQTSGIDGAQADPVPIDYFEISDVSPWRHSIIYVILISIRDDTRK